MPEIRLAAIKTKPKAIIHFMRRIIPSLAALGLFILTISLGNWQLRRADFKLHLAEARETAAKGEAPWLTEVLNADGTLNTASEAGKLRAQALAYGIRVRVLGQWRPDHTVFIDNRTMKGVAGFHVFTPLAVGVNTLELDREAIPGRPATRPLIAVNRGWIAANLKDRNVLPIIPTPMQALTFEAWLEQPQKALELGSTATGSGKPSGTPGAISAAGDNTKLWQNYDATRMGAKVGQAVWPWVLRQSSLPTEPMSPPEGLNRDWPVHGNDVAKHQGYAVQWFGLAGLTLVLWTWFVLLKSRFARKREVKAGSFNP